MEALEGKVIELAYALDTFYFLVMGAFVMWMAAGFTMLESGLVRAKNTAEILTKNISLYSISVIMYMVVGYNLMYPGGGTGVIPELSFFLGADNTAEAVIASGGDVYYSGISDHFFQVVFVATALTSQIWLIYEKDGEWHTESVGTIGDPAKIPLPVDISITADDQHLWVNTWNDGMTRVFDISDPHMAKEVYTHKIGDQVNMLSQSWDGKRVYFTSSLLANWEQTDQKKCLSSSKHIIIKMANWNSNSLLILLKKNLVCLIK